MSRFLDVGSCKAVQLQLIAGKCNCLSSKLICRIDEGYKFTSPDREMNYRNDEEIYFQHLPSISDRSRIPVRSKKHLKANKNAYQDPSKGSIVHTVKIPIHNFEVAACLGLYYSRGCQTEWTPVHIVITPTIHVSVGERSIDVQKVLHGFPAEHY